MALTEIILVTGRGFGGRIQGIFVGQFYKFLDFVSFFSPFVLYNYIKHFQYEFVNLKNYLVATLVLALTALVAVVSDQMAQRHPYLFLTAPVIINALYGGVGPAVFSILAGIIIANLITNNFHLSKNIFQLSPIAITYALEGLLISWISVVQKRRHQNIALNLVQEQTARLKAQSTSQNLIRLEKQKDDFIAITAHELRNPLASIKAFTQLLEIKTVATRDKQIKQYIIKMEEQTTRLNELVNQLFDVSSMSNGQMQLNRSIVNFDEVILSTIIDLQHTISTHKIVVEGHVKTEISVDTSRIKEVIINLVTNAVKYSPHSNQIIVRLSSTPKQVIFSVKDFGEGISTLDQKRIFERFYRAGSYNVSGLGLGLYIASEIVKQHKGKIWLTSSLGKGSTFFFSLPK